MIEKKGGYKMGANRIAFINGKGGCGKTTSMFHIAGALAKAGEKVLVVDLDKQRNTSKTMLLYTEFPPKSVLDVMVGEASPEEATAQVLAPVKRSNENAKYYGVECMVASVGLEDETLLSSVDQDRFGELMDTFIKEGGYTWVLVDMPPSNKILNNICFSRLVDYILCPFSSDLFAVDGYGDIMDTIEKARELNPALSVLGIYLSRYMANCGVDRFVKSQLEEFDSFIDVQIPLATDVREAVMFGRPVCFYKKNGKSAAAYESLLREVKKRINRKN